ncbi:hypothetical protein LBMAG48_14230 [Phycisphaerae bacterium]|nr:hypothetical protein LBMAG48_14230 [Phycisphaerae bacterium]
MNSTDTEPAPGQPVGTYALACVPDDALARLRVLIDTKFVTRAPRFAAWMLDLIDNEAIRRCRSMIGPPREPSMPTLDHARWTNAEVGEAILVANVLASVVTDPAARTFASRVNSVLIALASSRLERADLTNDEPTEE